VTLADHLLLAKMFANKRTLFALTLFVFFASVVNAQNDVPVYMWNIDTDAIANPLKVLDSRELVETILAPSHQLIAIFMQDELSAQDFKSEDLSAIESVAKSVDGGTFYHPSISNPENLLKSLAENGYQIVNIKSDQDLPRALVDEPTVLVIELPLTQKGDFRSENLQLNGNHVASVFGSLRSRQSNVLGVFTSAKNSNAVAPLKRVSRSALSASSKYINTDLFINATGELFLYIEKPPVLKLRKNDKGADVMEVYTLDAVPDFTGSGSGSLVLKYNNIKAGEMTLKSADLTLMFAKQGGYWFISSSSITLETTNWPLKSYELKSTDIFTPVGFSYHCTPKLTIAKSKKNTENNETIVVEMNGFQLQPFRKPGKNSFGDWYDCQGFFTEAIWAAIFLGLVIAAVLAWAISMLADVKGPDRFDDPKGKTITVSATD